MHVSKGKKFVSAVKNPNGIKLIASWCYPRSYYFILAIGIFITSFLGLVAQSHKPKTFAEKKQIAKEMKPIAKALGVKCKDCHSEAERGLRAADFTLLTKKGQFSHDVMFPLAKTYKVTCDYCHSGFEKLTVAGRRAKLDADAMKEYNAANTKKRTCETCHVPPVIEADNPFSELTKFGKKSQL